MTEGTRTESNNQKHSLLKSKVDEEDVEMDEIEIPQKCTIYDRIYDIAEKFASTKIGQFITDRADRTLKVIEETAKWSLPQDKTEYNLERPIAWIPFLTLIVMLRLLRIWLSVSAMLIGKEPVTPHKMVYFIQTRRRKLRAIRVHGAKAIRQREIEVVTYKTSTTNSETGLMYKLRNLLSIAICRPGQQRNTERSIFNKKESIYEENCSNDHQASKRPRDDSCNDHNLTIDQMLAKYANEDSDDDSDFIPNPEEETNDDASTSSASDSSDVTDEEINVETPTMEDTNRKTNKENEKENTSVEIQKNGSKKTIMPKPMKEIKMEPYSDVDSVNEEAVTPKEKHITSNGNEKHGETAMAKNKLGLTNGIDEKQKSTLVNETAAVAKPLALNATATAGSPSNFNACFSSLSNASTSNATATSSPITTDENSIGVENCDSSSAQTTTHPQPIYQKQQHYYYNQRYRGKNRRY